MLDAVRGRTPRAARRPARESLPIGETDANIFDCPVCARPLVAGTRRCPVCATRLLMGIKASLGFGLMAVGLTVGLVAGGATMAAYAVMTRPAAVAVIEPAPVVAPSSAPAASAPIATGQVPAAPVPVVPAAAISGLRQSAIVNQRIVDDAVRLQLALDAAQPSTADISRSLRSLASTAAFGDRIAPGVAAWPDGDAVSAALVEFYASIGATARAGLAASIGNTAAYVDAGRRMVDVLAGLAVIDADSRALAATADVDLPAVSLATDSNGSTDSTTP